MPIKINGTELSTQPTTHNWIPKVLLGSGGAGHGFYAAVQEYELTWEAISAADFNQLVGFFNSIGVTGTAVVELPRYGGVSYTFQEYSGCIVNQLETQSFFEQHILNVNLLISNIRIA